MTRILNIYIKRPLLFDILICVIFCYLSTWLLPKLHLKLDLKAEDLKAIMTDEMTTSITLVGFILASLTIIVTFKDNITRKIQNEIKPDTTNLNNQLTGLEILFSSKHYKRIVGVFTSAAFIYLIMFMFCSLTKIYISIINLIIVYYISLSFLIILFFTVLRCLTVLYSIIKLQINN